VLSSSSRRISTEILRRISTEILRRISTEFLLILAGKRRILYIVTAVVPSVRACRESSWSHQTVGRFDGKCVSQLVYNLWFSGSTDLNGDFAVEPTRLAANLCRNILDGVLSGILSVSLKEVVCLRMPKCMDYGWRFDKGTGGMYKNKKRPEGSPFWKKPEGEGRNNSDVPYLSVQIGRAANPQRIPGRSKDDRE